MLEKKPSAVYSALDTGCSRKDKEQRGMTKAWIVETVLIYLLHFELYFTDHGKTIKPMHEFLWYQMLSQNVLDEFVWHTL